MGLGRPLAWIPSWILGLGSPVFTHNQTSFLTCHWVWSQAAHVLTPAQPLPNSDFGEVV